MGCVPGTERCGGARLQLHLGRCAVRKARIARCVGARGLRRHMAPSGFWPLQFVFLLCPACPYIRPADDPHMPAPCARCCSATPRWPVWPTSAASATTRWWPAPTSMPCSSSRCGGPGGGRWLAAWVPGWPLAGYTHLHHSCWCRGSACGLLSCADLAGDQCGLPIPASACVIDACHAVHAVPRCRRATLWSAWTASCGARYWSLRTSSGGRSSTR